MHELPVVRGLVQPQLEHAVGDVVAHLAVRGCRAEGAELRTAGADNDLAHAVRCIGLAACVLGCEALVVVVVADEQQLDAVVVEGLPERLERRDSRSARTRAPARTVPHCHNVLRRAPGEIRPQPLLLRRCAAAGQIEVALAVEDDDMPVVADVVAVIALVAVARRPGEVADAVEVVEVAAAVVAVVAVVVVADRRTRPRLDPRAPPGRRVARWNSERRPLS